MSILKVWDGTDWVSINVGSNHGLLSGLSDDDHPQYILADGTRAFTGPVSGQTPTVAAHLTTKDYVDSVVAPSLVYDDLLGLSSASQTGVLSLTGESGVYIDETTYSGTSIAVGTTFYGDFTGHIGNSNIHFTQSEISITESQISDLGDYATNSELDSVSGYFQTHVSNTSNPHSVTALQVGAPDLSDFTGHTGNTDIHYTQASISITESQISDLGDYALLSNFTGHTGDGSIHFTQGEISITESQISDLGDYSTNTQYDYLSGEFNSHASDSSIHFTQSTIGIAASQITGGSFDDARISESSVTQHQSALSITESQISDLGSYITLSDIAGLSGDFTGHTGDSSIHFTQAEISITESQISDLGDYALNSKVDTLSGYTQSHISNTSNPHSVTAVQVGAPTVSEFTGHTGDTSIHYTQASISITESQISDLQAYALDTDFDSHTGNINIHFQESDIDHESIQNIGTFTHADIDDHINDSANPHSVTTTQIGAATLSAFTGHTGDSTIHFTEASIDHDNIQNKGINDHASIDAHLSSSFNPHSVTAAQVGAPTTAEFSSHTGDATVHFTQASISITESQISDLGDYVLTDASNGFTNPVSGETATQSYHLTRKDYVDTADSNLNTAIAGNLSLITALTAVLTGHTGEPEAHQNYYKILDHDDFYEFASSKWDRDLQGNGNSFVQNVSAASWMTGLTFQGAYRLSTNGSASSNADRVLINANDTTSYPSIYSQSGYHYIWRAALDNTNNYLCHLGIGEVTASTTGMPSPAICFEFDSANTNILCKANDGAGTEETIDTGITLSTYEQTIGTFELKTTSTSIEVYIDGALVGTFSSGLPAATDSFMYPIAQNVYNGSTFRSITIDRFELGTSRTDYMPNSQS